MTPLRKEVRRKTAQSFLHYRRQVIVELVPGDVIRLRLLGQRVSSSVSIQINWPTIQELSKELRARRMEAKL